MNNDDIIRLAIEHTINGLKFNEDGLLRFAKLIAQHEREACALRAEEFLAEPDQEWGGDFWNQAIERVASAIRARGQA
jgi:hypothetical protein